MGTRAAAKYLRSLPKTSTVADPDLQLVGEGFKGLTMNVEFCEDNSGSSKKMLYFRKITGGTGPSPGSATDQERSLRGHKVRVRFVAENRLIQFAVE